MKFSVWAPSAKTVELCAAGERHPLHRTVARDYWEAEIEVPPAGLRYRYSIDGGTPIPDPWSRWQPDGVHGDSCATALPRPPKPLATPKPLSSAVLYEIHIGTFTPEGTYVAARRRLLHLVSLGITHIELMPVATFPGQRGWGYDGTFWFAPHPAYGTPADLADFVTACHEHGLAVILDVVYNHLGPDGNYLPQFGPCFSSQRTLWGEALNFDGPHSDGLRQMILDNATYWLRDFGFDGLRLDAVHAIIDQRALPLLEELTRRVSALERDLKRPLALVAESDLHDPRLVRPAAQGGFGLHAFWADDFHHAVHRFLTGERHGYYADFDGLADIVRAIGEGYIYQGQFAPSRRRSHGRPPVGITSDQLVFCVQNHDQIGNRAAGERLGQLLPPEKLKAAAALLLLAPQVPLLFQGEEWGARTPFLYFTDHVDSKLGEAVTAGRRREFPAENDVADPQDPDTFRRSRLDWTELDATPHAVLLAWYRSLISLRRRLHGANCIVEADEPAGWLTLVRDGVLAVFNFAAQPQRIRLPHGNWRLELTSIPGDADGDLPVPAGATQIFVDRNAHRPRSNGNRFPG